MLIVEVPQTALECRAIAVVVIVNQKSCQQPINSLWWCTMSGRQQGWGFRYTGVKYRKLLKSLIECYAKKAQLTDLDP